MTDSVILKDFLHSTLARMKSSQMHVKINHAERWTRFDIAPPATEAELSAVERQLGKRLPDSLRQFFGEVSSGMDISWEPHTRIVRHGDQDIDVIHPPLPESLLQWAYTPGYDGSIQDFNYRSPKISGGLLRFGPSEVISAHQGRDSWLAIYDPKDATDPETREQLEGLHAFFLAGFPFATTQNGDWLAVDMSTTGERLQHVSHEGEEAGIQLDQQLSDFMVEQTMLGFPGIDFSELFLFDADAVSNQANAAEYAEVRDIRFRADSPAGIDWMKWLWTDSRPKRP